MEVASTAPTYTDDVTAPWPPSVRRAEPQWPDPLCELPESEGIGHHFGQHLGQDRHGFLRGWRQRRANPVW